MRRKTTTERTALIRAAAAKLDRQAILDLRRTTRPTTWRAEKRRIAHAALDDTVREFQYRNIHPIAVQRYLEGSESALKSLIKAVLREKGLDGGYHG